MLEREFLAFHRGVAWGTAWLAAIEALGRWAKRNGRHLPRREYWECGKLYTCWCVGCGRARLKEREAGVDEDTPSELCGECYFKFD
jgi:hypothetical protein